MCSLRLSWENLKQLQCAAVSRRDVPAIGHADSYFSLVFLFCRLVASVTKYPVQPVSGIIYCGGVKTCVFKRLFNLFIFKHNAAPSCQYPCPLNCWCCPGGVWYPVCCACLCGGNWVLSWLLFLSPMMLSLVAYQLWYGLGCWQVSLRWLFPISYPWVWQ